ncbi:MAG: hypothetical protein Q9168_003459 [Polycauliona sp. 1 TL-2023]
MAKSRTVTPTTSKPPSSPVESPSFSPLTSIETPRSDIQDNRMDSSDSAMELSPKPSYKSKPTCLLPKLGQSWHVSISSMTSKCFRWSEDDYEPGLNFGFEVQFSSFCLSTAEKEVYTLDGSHGCIPFLAIATIGDRPRFRLIPVTSSTDLQSEVYDIEIDGAEMGEQMVRHLVAMGCTVVQRPEG